MILCSLTIVTSTTDSFCLPNTVKYSLKNGCVSCFIKFNASLFLFLGGGSAL